ncbi:MAG: rhomboid family intramembrane serine protease [Bacteroidota bacterium]
MSYEQYRPAGFKLLPPVVKNLLIINILFFIAKYVLGNAMNVDLDDMLGLHYFGAEKFKPYQIVSYMFMHGDITHILFNMLALWMFGYVLENVWGPKRFLTYYILCGLGAAAVHYIIVYFQVQPVLEAIEQYKASPGLIQFKQFIDNQQVFQVASYDIQNHFNTFSVSYNGIIHNSDSLAQTAQHFTLQAQNISDSISMLHAPADSLRAQVANLNQMAQIATQQSDSLQQAAVTFNTDFINQYREDYLNAPVIIGASGAVFGILLAFGMMFPNTLVYVYFAIPMKAKWFVILYGGLELVLGVSNRSGDNVAHFAHLGGMLVGFIILMIWKRNNRKKMFENRE